MDPARKRGIFVGYSESAKAYWIYIPDQQKMELRRDVTFEEDMAYRRSRRSDWDSDDSQEIFVGQFESFMVCMVYPCLMFVIDVNYGLCLWSCSRFRPLVEPLM